MEPRETDPVLALAGWHVGMKPESSRRVRMAYASSGSGRKLRIDSTKSFRRAATPFMSCSWF